MPTYTADMTHNISTPMSMLGIQFIQALKHIFNFVHVIPVGLKATICIFKYSGESGLLLQLITLSKPLGRTKS